MKRVGNYGATACGVLLLSLAISMTGLGQSLASGVSANAQQVLITNKVLPVSGNVKAVPLAPSQPVQFSASVPVNYDQAKIPVSAHAYTVPARKRLVIEYVSVDYPENYENSETVLVSFKTGSGPQFFVPLAYEGTSHAFHLVGSSEVKVYANPGSTVTAIAAPVSVIAKSQVRFSFSGYLVSA